MFHFLSAAFQTQIFNWPFGHVAIFRPKTLMVLQFLLRNSFTQKIELLLFKWLSFLWSAFKTLIIGSVENEENDGLPCANDCK